MTICSLLFHILFYFTIAFYLVWDDSKENRKSILTHTHTHSSTNTLPTHRQTHKLTQHPLLPCFKGLLIEIVKSLLFSVIVFWFSFLSETEKPFSGFPLLIFVIFAFFISFFRLRFNASSSLSLLLFFSSSLTIFHIFFLLVFCMKQSNELNGIYYTTSFRSPLHINENFIIWLRPMNAFVRRGKKRKKEEINADTSFLLFVAVAAAIFILKSFAYTRSSNDFMFLY